MRPLTQIKQMLAVLGLGALTACGGGGGGGSGGGGAGSPAPVVQSSPVITLAAGMYVDSSTDMSIALMPVQSGSRVWYGLRPTAGLPVLYRGLLDATSLSGSATSYVGGYGGSTTWTAPTTTSLTASLTIDPTDNPARMLAANQVAALSTAALTDHWVGVWTLKDASATSQTMSLTVPGTTGSATIPSFLGCSVSVNSFTQSDVTGVYNVSLMFTSLGSCPISGTRTGVLMAYSLAGNKHVRWVAFDAADTTQGVSFRAALPAP